MFLYSIVCLFIYLFITIIIVFVIFLSFGCCGKHISPLIRIKEFWFWFWFGFWFRINQPSCSVSEEEEQVLNHALLQLGAGPGLRLQQDGEPDRRHRERLHWMKLKSAAHLSAAARCFYFVAPTGSVWCVHLHLLAEVCQVRTECSGAPRIKLRVYRVCRTWRAREAADWARDLQVSERVCAGLTWAAFVSVWRLNEPLQLRRIDADQLVINS